MQFILIFSRLGVAFEFEEHMNLFVAGFPLSFGNKELSALLEKYGTVHAAKVILHRDTGLSRGFGCVEMPEEAEAKRAIKNLHDEPMEDKTLTVKEARPKE